ncbi:MAG: hypothetical protein ACE5HP_04290 [Gemmatimonadota bacterium]
MLGSLVAAGLGTGCASGGESGPLLENPASVARRLEEETGASRPARIRFRWEYGDENGRLRGDGVARINPPDSFRLDLFTTGEGSMAVTLTADSLATLGEIEDVRLPPPPFLYAMAGVFRPGGSASVAGHGSREDAVLEFAEPGGRRLVFFVEAGRLARLEERSEGRVTQRIRVRWGGSGKWPQRAEYRDLVSPRRVRWTLQEEAEEPIGFPAEIYDLSRPN